MKDIHASQASNPLKLLSSRTGAGSPLHRETVLVLTWTQARKFAAKSRWRTAVYGKDRQVAVAHRTSILSCCHQAPQEKVFEEKKSCHQIFFPSSCAFQSLTRISAMVQQD